MAAERPPLSIRVDLIEALHELYPGRSDREILEGIVREYLLCCSIRDAQARTSPGAA